MNAPPSPWTARLDAVLQSLRSANPEAASWREADVRTIQQTLQGVSPYSGSIKPDQGARVVFNISSAHIPSFMTGAPHGAYLNRYAVAAGRVGGAPKVDARTRIDDLLGAILGVSGKNLHYGAADLNGAGIRYYGDICLVLKADAVADGALVLDRNSFDLICPPLVETTAPGGAWNATAAKAAAKDLSGRWKSCFVAMASCKILEGGPSARRRMTIGMISEGLLTDEDYVEVVRDGSFGRADVAEARTAAGDAAADASVADRLLRGPTPDLTALLWRHRRRLAEAALSADGLSHRTVVSAGRVRA